MQPISLNIIIGVVAGLLTASFLLVIKSLILNSFFPWYRNAMFKGIDLNGSWHSVSSHQKVLLEIKQSCEMLSGKATVHLTRSNAKSPSGDPLHIDDIRTFDIKGEVSERFVSLKLKHTDRSRVGLVTYLLQVDGDGTKLSGGGCWYSPLASCISSGHASFYRDETRAVKQYQQNVTEKSDSDNNENES